MFQMIDCSYERTRQAALSYTGMHVHLAHSDTDLDSQHVISYSKWTPCWPEALLHEMPFMDFIHLVQISCFSQIPGQYYREVPKLHLHIAGKVENILSKKRSVRVVGAKCEYRLLWWDFQGSITPKSSKNQWFHQITPKYYGEVPKLHHHIAGRVENILYKKRGVRVVGAKCEYRLLW